MNWKFQFSCHYASVPSTFDIVFDSLTEIQLSRQWTWTRFLYSSNQW